MMEKKQREQEKVEDKELYVICCERTKENVEWPEKYRAEENKGTLAKVAGIRGYSF